jgi:hypothetical protein
MKSLCYIVGAASHRRTHDALAVALSVFQCFCDCDTIWSTTLSYGLRADSRSHHTSPHDLYDPFIRLFYQNEVANKLDKIHNGRVSWSLKHDAFYQIKLLNRNTNSKSKPLHCPPHILTVTRVRVCYTAVHLYSTRHYEISGPDVDEVVGAYGRRFRKNAH